MNISLNIKKSAKWFKKVLIFIAVILLVLPTTLFLVACRKNDPYEGFFRLNDCGESYTIMRWVPETDSTETWTFGHLKIPAYHNGKPVTAIDGRFEREQVRTGEYNRFGNTLLQTIYTRYVTIPYTIERIESNSFSYFSSTGGRFVLNFAENSRLRYIGAFSFIDIRSFSLGLTEKYQEIADREFIPDNLSPHNPRINIVLPESVEYIGAGAFALNRITGLFVGKNVRRIGVGAFSESHITRYGIAVHEYNEHFYINNGHLFGYDDYRIERTLLIGDGRFEIPHGTRRIAGNAFQHQDPGIANVQGAGARTLPPSVESVGYNVFTPVAPVIVFNPSLKYSNLNYFMWVDANGNIARERLDRVIVREMHDLQVGENVFWVPSHQWRDGINNGWRQLIHNFKTSGGRYNVRFTQFYRLGGIIDSDMDDWRLDSWVSICVFNVAGKRVNKEDGYLNLQEGTYFLEFGNMRTFDGGGADATLSIQKII